MGELELNRISDTILNECSEGVVTYVFQNKSHEQVARKPVEKKSEEELDEDFKPGDEREDDE